MSRIIRKQMLALVKTLGDTNRKLGETIVEKHWDEINGVLKECQETAIAIRDEMELVYGTGYEVMHFLDEYCETVYHIAPKIGCLGECNRYLMLAGEQLAAVNKLINEEIPDRLEIVFCPCKVSEWTCLESIYLSARQDKNCDVFCVPIPYYNLNPDSTLGELYDESREYPQDVQITDWKDYEFGVRKPDMVFVHNLQGYIGTDRTDNYVGGGIWEIGLCTVFCLDGYKVRHEKRFREDAIFLRMAENSLCR